ncbi:hypothetical protein V7S43_003820 [Phytophthora oleae]|uniref:PiggyBac transposable element-derived protein domain-containing protein n=1 Tax=Phytophthora oleae TaxID=2107226 RepID=A0ABD3FV57_9STRA
MQRERHAQPMWWLKRLIPHKKTKPCRCRLHRTCPYRTGEDVVGNIDLSTLGLFGWRSSTVETYILKFMTFIAVKCKAVKWLARSKRANEEGPVSVKRGAVTALCSKRCIFGPKDKDSIGAHDRDAPCNKTEHSTQHDVYR